MCELGKSAQKCICNGENPVELDVEVVRNDEKVVRNDDELQEK